MMTLLPFPLPCSSIGRSFGKSELHRKDNFPIYSRQKYHLKFLKAVVLLAHGGTTEECPNGRQVVGSGDAIARLGIEVLLHQFNALCRLVAFQQACCKGFIVFAIGALRGRHVRGWTLESLLRRRLNNKQSHDSLQWILNSHVRLKQKSTGKRMTCMGAMDRICSSIRKHFYFFNLSTNAVCQSGMLATEGITDLLNVAIDAIQ